MSLTYSRYLQIEQLLDLQNPRSEGPEHDETLFIVIHQVYELWFKQTLHELDFLADLFENHSPDHNNTPPILHTLRRTLTILKTMVAQVDILETMTPISFASFRSRLETASGFQSAQFREVEFLLGQRDRKKLKHHEEHPKAHAKLTRRLEEPTIYQRFLAYLQQSGFSIPDEVLRPLDDGPPPENAAVREILVHIYRNEYRLAQVCERLVDLDEGLQEWRYRHVKMVQRTIGGMSGTGGSAGAAYLQSTLFRPAFPDLWTIRDSF